MLEVPKKSDFSPSFLPRALVSPPARPRAGGIASFLHFFARKLVPKRVMEAEGCGAMRTDSLGLFVYRPFKKPQQNNKKNKEVFSYPNKDKTVLERN